VAIMYEFARHSSHNVDNDIMQSGKTLKLEYNLFISIRSDKSSMAERQ
jgi:hypothetical protein